MKKVFSTLIITAVITLTPLIMKAQGPPDPGGGPGEGDDPVGGGGAPLASGLFLTTGFVVAYGARKIYYFKNNSEDKKRL